MSSDYYQSQLRRIWAIQANEDYCDATAASEERVRVWKIVLLWAILLFFSVRTMEYLPQAAPQHHGSAPILAIADTGGR